MICETCWTFSYQPTGDSKLEWLLGWPPSLSSRLTLQSSPAAPPLPRPLHRSPPCSQIDRSGSQLSPETRFPFARGRAPNQRIQAPAPPSSASISVSMERAPRRKQLYLPARSSTTCDHRTGKTRVLCHYSATHRLVPLPADPSYVPCVSSAAIPAFTLVA
jgi:hypothetical protein